MPFRQNAKDTAKYGAGTIALAAVALVVLLIISAMYLFGFGLFSQKTANFRGETSKRNQIEANGAFRVSAYNRFFDLCASVQSFEAQIANLEQERDDKANPPSDSRREQIASSITALRNTRSQTINQYNADAAKDYTAGQFRDNNLPYRLNPTQEVTTCAV